jgi:hypothetical protein
VWAASRAAARSGLTPHRGRTGRNRDGQQHPHDGRRPPQAGPDLEHPRRDLGGNDDGHPQQAHRAPVGQRQPQPHHDDDDMGGDHQQQHDAVPAGNDDQQQHSGGRRGEREPGQPPLVGRGPAPHRCRHRNPTSVPTNA